MADQNVAPIRYGGVVLAAGEARRMGGRPKPLIERDGVPLVRRVAGALVGAAVGEIVVVLGHRGDEVETALAGLPVRQHQHQGYAAGRVSSLRAGLRALNGTADAVIVALADQPLLEATDVSTLMRAFEDSGMSALVPRVAGVRGHPVLLDREACLEILAGDETFGARQWMAANPSRIAWFSSENRRYCEDVDSAEDLERIAQQYGCAMRWPE